MNKSLTGFDHNDRIFGRTNPLKLFNYNSRVFQAEWS